MVNTKEVMHLAWKLFRDYAPYCRKNRTLAERMAYFGQCLKAAWKSVRETARKAALSVAELAKEEIAKINSEIDQLYYLLFGMKVADRRESLIARRAQYEAILARA